MAYGTLSMDPEPIPDSREHRHGGVYEGDIRKCRSPVAAPILPQPLDLRPQRGSHNGGNEGPGTQVGGRDASHPDIEIEQAQSQAAHQIHPSLEGVGDCLFRLQRRQSEGERSGFASYRAQREGHPLAPRAGAIGAVHAEAPGVVQDQGVPEAGVIWPVLGGVARYAELAFQVVGASADLVLNSIGHVLPSGPAQTDHLIRTDIPERVAVLGVQDSGRLAAVRRPRLRLSPASGSRRCRLN